MRNTIKIFALLSAMLAVSPASAEGPNDAPVEAQNGLKSATAEGWNVPFYEYVVITRKDLIPAFNDLITWKRQKGLNAGAVAIEDIIASPASEKGDVVSGIAGELLDDAARLRCYLTASRKKGIGKYVLLGGMGDVVPFRYGYNYIEENDTITPSDYYFSNLAGQWYDADKAKNGKAVYKRYGSEASISIYNKDAVLYVGRLLCRTESDIKTWIRKQLIYEQNPGKGDPSYLGRALFTDADGIINRYYKYGELDAVTNFIKISRISEAEDQLKGELKGPTAASVINEMNSVKYGFLLNGNHGAPVQYAIASKGDNKTDDNSKYQIVAMDDYDSKVDVNSKEGKRVLWMTNEESGNGFDNLTNYNQPAVMYSVSCDNIPFDDWKGYYAKHKMRNLGESFLCMNSGGGVAYFGHTRSAYQVVSSGEYDQFLQEVARTDQPCRFGVLLFNTVKGYKNFSHTLTHNLAGCPETYFWRALPQKFSGVNVSNEGEGKVKVSHVALTETENTENAFVCVTGTNTDGSFYQDTATIKPSQTQVTFTSVPSEYVVVVSCDGYLPYIYKSNECVMQDEVVAGELKKDCDNIIAGAHVKMGRPEGDVIIKNGADVTFAASKTTKLEGGFRVEKGGKLKIAKKSK